MMNDTFKDEVFPKDEETSCYEDKDSTNATQVEEEEDSLFKEPSSPRRGCPRWCKYTMLGILLIVLLHFLFFRFVALEYYNEPLEGDAAECDSHWHLQAMNTYNCTAMSCVTDGCLYECHCGSDFSMTSEFCHDEDMDDPSILSIYQGLWKCREHLTLAPFW